MLENNYAKIERKLKEILDNTLNTEKKEHSEDEIIKIEKKYNITLPVEYKLFVLKYGNSYTKDNIYYTAIEKSPWTPEDGFDSLGFFYGLENDRKDLRKMIEAYLGRIPDNLIPIADCDGGNELCIGVMGHSKGKVYFWNHENQNILKKGHIKNLYLVAESFTDFIMSFEVHERISKIDLDDVEIWLDDDLLND
ncbi:SMI1/KNR4 family protein [Clostridium polynesiense]|uniref:SMI1/KNR4 family protein n=1 Tax=Clostridium polynesiense TaxID=1325933 RepID=UPI00058B0340|nr:SMI1/KNR4 family protein [Clostridium polynesiense]